MNDNSENKLSGLNDTTDTTTEFDSKDIEQNKIMSLFAYLGIVNTLNGKVKELPIIGKYKLLK
jgi:ABC-type long-chain fatty acid transport system, fused permease and ATPase components